MGIITRNKQYGSSGTEGLYNCFQAPEDQPLMEAGLDSLAAVELRNSLSREFKLDLLTTVIFDYPSIQALGQHMVSQLPDMRPAVAVPQAASQVNVSHMSHPQDSFLCPSPALKGWRSLCPFAN